MANLEYEKFDPLDLDPRGRIWDMGRGTSRKLSLTGTQRTSQEDVMAWLCSVL